MRKRILQAVHDHMTGRDLTRGSIVRNIWVLAIPMMFGNFLQTTFSIVDMVWVGKLGPDAIAAVSLSGSILMVVMMLMIGIATGTTAMVARFIGARDHESANDVAMQSLILSAIGSLLLAVAGIGVADRMLEAMGASPEVVALGTGYLRLLLVGSVAMFLLFLTEAILRGAGDALTPTLILTGATVLHAVLDPLLIFGIGFPRMGVDGAAMATLVARGAGAAVALYVLFRGRSCIRLRPKHLRVDLSIMWRITRLGVPSSIQLTMRGVMGIVLMALVAGYGTHAVAAYGVGLRLLMFVLMPGFGLAVATATLVGQNLGAGAPGRAQSTAWAAARFSMLMMGAVGLLFYVFAGDLMGFFNKTAEVVEIGATYLRITSIGYIFIALSIVLGRAMNGAGDTVSPMVMTFMSLWCLQVPLALVLARWSGLGVSGIWWAALVASVVHGMMTTGWFQLGRWKLKRI